MQYCPLCNTEYNDITKVCPREHCANCGSLELKKKRHRTFKDYSSKINFEFACIFLPFFVLMTELIIYQEHYPNYYFIFPFIGLGVLISLAYFSQTKDLYDYSCKSCTFARFRPITNVEPSGEKSTVEEKKKLIDEHFAVSSSDPVVRELSRGHKYLIGIGIAGVMVTVIIWLVDHFSKKP